MKCTFIQRIKDHMETYGGVWEIVGVLLAFAVALTSMIMIAGCQSFFGNSNPTTGTVPGEEAFRQVTGKVGWVVTLAILGMAVSSMAFMNGSKAALGPLVGSGVALTMSLMVVRFASLLAIVGLIAAVVLFGLAVWSRRKALIEIVKTVQEGKEKLAGSDIVSLAHLSGYLDRQSPSTQKIVKKIKEKLNATTTNTKSDDPILPA